MADLLSVFKKDINLGNLISLVTILTAVILAFATLRGDVKAHISDFQLHPTIREREDLIDKRVAMQDANLAFQVSELSKKVEEQNRILLEVEITNGKVERKLNRYLEAH